MMRKYSLGAVLRGIRSSLVLAAWLVATGPVCADAPTQAASRGSSVVATAPVAATPADLVIANRTIMTMRVAVLGVPPAERARSIAERAEALVARGGPLRVSTGTIAEGMVVMVDGQALFRVFPGDVDDESGTSLAMATADAATKLDKALREMREARDSRALVPAIVRSLVATVIFAIALWCLFRAASWIARKASAYFHRKTAELAPSWGRQVLGRSGMATLATAPVKLAAWVLALLASYEWVAFVLDQFPYSRPWGEALFGNLVNSLGSFGSRLLKAIPGLLFVALVFAIARVLVRLVRAFFEGVETGRVHVGWVDEITARPTARLFTWIIWLFAFVAAYPYIPGSDSEAFKGIGVFVGLMLSIGSSGIVNQAVSGLMLMYTRALRPGEFVQVGETEGVVKSVGFLTTRIETLRREEINVPNALIAASVTRNYSRLAPEGGVRVPTKVTIGYDTPWRQVRAMLLLAAERTSSVTRSPPPTVLQTALQDFYVEYTLLVGVADPAQRYVALDELHANIQDVFNEHGVQIMSPNYEADPAQPKVVPPSDWYKPPAPPRV